MTEANIKKLEDFVLSNFGNETKTNKKKNKIKNSPMFRTMLYTIIYYEQKQLEELTIKIKNNCVRVGGVIVE